MNRIDRLIVGCPNWAALWAALTTSTEVEPGEAFERVTQLYLQSHPEYRTQLEHVWRVPEEVPPRIRQRLNLPSTDEGIDLLARTHDGRFWAIQCKFRSDTKKPLTYGELSTFTSLAFVTCKDISLAVVAHTCSKPVRKHKYLGNATEIGLDRWLGLTDEDWQGIQGQIKGRITKLKPRSPRPHQQAAIQAAQKHFATEARGRMIMPCATGKSLTAFWIARALDAKSIIVAVPSLALIRQSLLDWTREYLAHGEEPQWLVVCSDESTGKLEQDEFVGQTYDLGIPTTTQSEEIVPFLRKRTGRRIVFTTYQSSGTLAAAAREAEVTIDLAILDEAHKTVGVKSKAFATLLSDASIPVQRRLFMTATERVLRGESDDVFSMDDEAVYGQRFHQLTFKDAIAQGIISDYKILTITVSDQTIRDLVAENRLIDVKGDETDAQSLAAAVALRRSFEKHGITHAISFHRSIKAASTFAERQGVLDDAMRSPLTSLHVSSKKSAGERAELMREFVGERRALMTNARCLTEGVDVPAIDCVLFADPKQSVVDIVQAAGRALRPYPGKDYGYILLPLVVPAGMTVDTFAETTEFKQVARTITALSTQDERIAEQFRVVEHGRSSKGKIVEIEGDVPKGLRLSLDAFADQIGLRLWERLGATWEERFQQLLRFRDKFGHCDVPYDYTEDMALARWVTFQRFQEGRKTLSTVKRAQLNAVGFSWDLRRDAWDEMCARLEAQVQREGPHLLGASKIGDRRVEKWLEAQRGWYRSGRLRGDRAERLERLGIVWNLLPERAAMITELLEFKEANGHCDVPITDGTRLARWVFTQRRYRRVGKLPEAEVAELDRIGFVWDPHDEAWERRFQQLRHFYERFGHSAVPHGWPEDPTLFSWVDRQRQAAKRERLSSERRQRLESLELALSANASRWQDRYAALKKLMTDVGIARIEDLKTLDQTLKSWVVTQRRRHRRGAMPDNEVRLMDSIGMRWE